jgi:hypothetical protein
MMVSLIRHLSSNEVYRGLVRTIAALLDARAIRASLAGMATSSRRTSPSRRAALYVRVSPIAGRPVENQLQPLQDAARRLGWSIVDSELMVLGTRERDIDGTSVCHDLSVLSGQCRGPRFGLGWLTTETPQPAIDNGKLQGDVAKPTQREKLLASKLQELDNDGMFDTVMAQLCALRAKRDDAITRLSAARKQVAVSQPVVITDVTDRAAIATALRTRCTSLLFGADHMVTIETRSHALIVTAAGQPASMLGEKEHIKRATFNLSRVKAMMLS